MKLLYVAHRIPYPPNKGDKIRSYHTLRYLARRHEVWCACLVDDPADRAHVDTLRVFCRDVIAVPLDRRTARLRALASLALDEPGSDGFYQSHALAGSIRRLARDVGFDTAVFFSSSMGQYIEAATARRNIIDFCDLDSRKWAELARQSRSPRSWALAAEARWLSAREEELHQRCDATILISSAEAEAWAPSARTRLHVIENGVTLPATARGANEAEPVAGFVGDMRYPPNEDAVIWFTQEVWPGVRAACPDAQFRIVGRGPSRRVRRLQRIAGVRVTGEVPDVFAELAAMRIVVAPLRIARGVQNKVLEAMAAARPVVATQAALTGIDAGPQHGIRTSDDPRQMIRTLVELLGDPEHCANLGRAARARVAERYDWEKVLAPWQTLLKAPADTLSPPPGKPVLVEAGA
jgi:sugar transferase (PEP-CTERM/EpsH1 system associated)